MKLRSGVGWGDITDMVKLKSFYQNNMCIIVYIVNYMNNEIRIKRMVNFYKTHSKPLRDKWRYGYYYKIRNAFFFLTHGRKMTFADMVDITDLTKAEPKELMCLNESRPQLQNPQKNIAKRKHVHVAGILSPLKNLRKRIIDD